MFCPGPFSKALYLNPTEVRFVFKFSEIDEIKQQWNVKVGDID